MTDLSCGPIGATGAGRWRLVMTVRQKRQGVLEDIRARYMDEVVGVRGRFALRLDPPADFVNAQLERLGADWRVQAASRGYELRDMAS